MAYQATVYKVLITSPADVGDARRAIQDVLNSWNSIHAEYLGAVVLPIMWETHAVPQMGDRPQEIINREVVENCDLLVGTFWTRIGTHTGVAESGSVEEIEEFIKAGKPVMLYFSSVPVVPDSIDFEQYERLQRFKAKCQKDGLYDSYSSIGELREKLTNHLTRKIRAMHQPTGQAQVEEDAPALEDPLPAMAQQFDIALLRRETEWVAERDSQPMSDYEGKRILKRLGEDALNFRVMLDGKVDHDAISILTDVVKRCRAIQNHEIYLDGGKSYKAFWTEGDSLIQKMKDAQNKLKAAVQQANRRRRLRATTLEELLLEALEGREVDRKRALAKAKLGCKLRRHDEGSNDWVLTVTNSGDATASDIHVHLGGDWLNKTHPNEIPKSLQPGEDFKVDLVNFEPKPMAIKLIWKDPDGKQRGEDLRIT
jgi:hypothetical protein